MHRLALLAPVALLACGAHQKLTVGLDEVPPGSKCTRSAALDTFVGQAASAQLGAQMMAAARAPHLRWMPAGAPATRDHSTKRLTVQLDSQSRVVSARCG